MKRSYFIICCIYLLAVLNACQDSTTNARSPQAGAAVVMSDVSNPDTIPVYIDSHAVFPDLILPDSVKRKKDPKNLWPIPVAPILPGAILPAQRILAYYGNLYSTRMGILGELPKKQMLDKLLQEAAHWSAADTTRPVKPALHLVAVTAQSKPGADGMYRLHMPDKMIDTIIDWAAEIDGLVFLDIQVGHSTLQKELPRLEKYLKLPQVHLGIDPEFSMKSGHAPGKKVGVFDAADINWATEYLEGLVRQYGLPPKILIVHRFKTYMVTNATQIKQRSAVQLVINMDGWGGPELKKSTQYHCIYKEPVEYTGFKIFYKNDLRGKGRVMTPEEVLRDIYPPPIYIQYQ